MAASDKTMPTRKAVNAGDDDVELPAIGVGAWSWGGGKDDYWGAQEQKETAALLEVALAAGPTFIDSAQIYNNGASESSIGEALKVSANAQNAIIGTKILPDNCTDEDTIRKEVDGSLKRLQVDSIDVFHVHWPVPVDDMPMVFSTLSALQTEGKIKHIAVSNFGVEQLTAALKTGAKIAINQLMYNLLSRGIEYEVLPLCAKEKIAIIGYSPLMQGLLTGKYDSIDDMSPYRTRLRHFKGDRQHSVHGGPGCETELMEAVNTVKKIAEDLKINMAQLSIAWCLANPNITCVIPGARNEEQLKKNYEAAHLELSEDTVSKLNAATDKVKELMGTKLDFYKSDADQRIW